MKTLDHPTVAAVNGIEGYTVLEFDILDSGEVSNINMVEAYPSNIFNQASINSVQGWKYDSRATTCQKVRLNFALG